MNPKKRKRDMLKIIIPEYILCEICKSKITNYRTYSEQIFVCCYDCYAVWKLSQQSTYLHEDAMKVEY